MELLYNGGAEQTAGYTCAFEMTELGVHLSM